MSFLREGKKLSYKEVIEMHQSLIKQNILQQLEVEEVNNLFMKTLRFTEERLNSCLAKGGYKADNAEQVFESATRLRLTSDISIWKQALEFQDKIERQEVSEKDKNDLVNFMSKSFLEAMQRLEKQLNIARNK